VERACFRLCLMLGRLLRAGTYSKVRIVACGDELQVRKRRAFYAPLLIVIGGPLMKILDTGVRVLARRDWEERERRIYSAIHDTAIRIESDTLVLPCLPGVTLASLLEDSELEPAARSRGIELAVTALADFHRMGFTHGDAMAENVMVDLTAGAARWFDFETVHDPRRAMAWRRADDVRALLATCLLRTAPGELAGALHRVLDVYDDEDVTRLVAAAFTSAMQRPLIFHLGQAGMSYRYFREIGRLLREYAG
jgi:hypothetical protein